MQTSFGLSCALALPCTSEGTIDLARLCGHAHRLLSSGCSSVTVFGTTGEGASVSLREREKVLSALARSGCNPRQQLLAGVMASSVGDAATQIELALGHACRGVLLAPPFYWKNVSDEGLYRWFSDVFTKVAASVRDIFLYHIPSTTQVPLSVDLIGRLKTAFPGMVIGVKDSGGDWNYTEQLLRTHRELTLLIGDERHLVPGLRLGARGAISGVANLFPGRLSRLIESGQEDAALFECIGRLFQLPFVPAVKALLALLDQDDVWRHVRPPLLSLPAAQVKSLVADCAALMP